MDIHVFHHIDWPERDGKLDQILAQLAALSAQGAQIMAKVDELELELQAANTATNDMAATQAEIAADIDDIQRQLAGGVGEAEADALKAKLQAHVATLNTLSTEAKAIAAKHTPGAPA